MRKFWMIVEISYGCDSEGFCLWDFIIPEFRRPKYCHGSKENAEEELLRLQKKVPSGEFVLLEAIAFSKFGDTAKNTIYIEPTEEEDNGC